MGDGGKLWDLLKPYARCEGFDFLRSKRVAVDLSCWIVQHETAFKHRARSPLLRLTFFRRINLFSKFEAFLVFVVDGIPSPLKSQARIARFVRSSGIDALSLPVAENGVSVERNSTFTKYIQECVDCKEKEQKKQESWRLKVLSKIALEPNFPNDEIIEMYLRNNHGYFNENDGPRVSWESPKTEMLVRFLTYHQRWEPSYIRQRMLPMLSTIF